MTPLRGAIGLAWKGQRYLLVSTLGSGCLPSGDVVLQRRRRRHDVPVFFLLAPRRFSTRESRRRTRGLLARASPVFSLFVVSRFTTGVVYLARCACPSRVLFSFHGFFFIFQGGDTQTPVSLPVPKNQVRRTVSVTRWPMGRCVTALPFCADASTNKRRGSSQPSEALNFL